MSKAKLKSIDLKTIDSFGKLLNVLQALGSTLPDSELRNLATFNKAYLVVTSAIEKASGKGYFENPKFIEKFTLDFSCHYFQMINQAMAGSDNIPVAWSNLIAYKKRRPLPNFIYLLMGANAHINHDLAIVMVRQLDNNTDNLIKDVLKVDQILTDCGYDILGTFTETQKLPRFIKNKTSRIYLPVSMRIILRWRVRAWKDYLSIKNGGLPPDRDQTEGKAISKQLLRLGKLLNR